MKALFHPPDAFRGRPRRPFVWLTLGAVVGILAADHAGFGGGVWLIFFLLAAVALARWPCRFVGCALVAAFAFASMHAWRIGPGGTARLADWLEEAGPVLIEAHALVLEDARVSGDGPRARTRFPARIESVRAGEALHPLRAKVLVTWTGAPPRYGDRVRFVGTAENIAGARNPGQFDARAHYGRQGMRSRVWVRGERDGEVLSSGHGNPLRAVAIRSRAAMEGWLRLDLEDSSDVAEVISGVVLGRGAGTPGELKARFRNTGTLHLFAVSGLHVAMFALLAWMLLRPLPLRRAHLALLVIPLLLFYALVTGLRPSVVRATTMTCIVLAGLLVERRSALANNLAAAAFLLLAADSNQLFTAGFLLSFSVVLAILALAGPFSRCFAKGLCPDPFIPESIRSRAENFRTWAGTKAGGMAAVSLAASLGSAPLMLLEFNLATPVGILANLFVVPLAFLVLSFGLLAVLAAPVSAALAVLFNNANWLVTHTMLLVIDTFALVPAGHFRAAVPEWGRRPMAALTVFDVGPGGAAFLQAGKARWVIDTGSEFDAQNIVLPSLWRLGVNRLDGLALTHGDARHIGGAQAVFEEFRPRRVLHSAVPDRSPARRQFAALLRDLRVGREIVRPGERIILSPEVSLEVLYPPPGLERRVADDKTLVFLLTAGPTRVLFLSDSGTYAERWLAQHHPGLRAEVVVKGWHATDYSGGTDFLAGLEVSAVVASAQDAHRRARRVPDWEEFLVGEDIRLFPQEETGAVTVRFYPDGFEVLPFLTGEGLRQRR